MKKIVGLGLILAVSFGLAGCGSSESGSDTKESSNNTEATSSKIAESTEVSVPKESDKKEVGFSNGTLKIDMATIKIISEEVLQPDANVYRENPQIAFVYEVTNDDSEPLDGSMAWIACMNAFQETENTVGKLEVGMTPQDEKFEQYRGGEFDELKPGGTKQYVIAYELNDTTTPVVLKATQGVGGKALGEMTYNLN